MSHYNHPRQRHRPEVPKPDVILVCPNCGAKFHPTHNKQYKCSKQCLRQPTADEKLIVERFKATCENHNLSASAIFTQLTGMWGYNLYDLIKPNPVYSSSKQKRERLLMTLKKFSDDFEKGFYDITRKVASRRRTPLEKRCPRNVPGCVGGFYPGDCPRHWRECEFAA